MAAPAVAAAAAAGAPQGCRHCRQGMAVSRRWLVRMHSCLPFIAIPHAALCPDSFSGDSVPNNDTQAAPRAQLLTHLVYPQSFHTPDMLK